MPGGDLQALVDNVDVLLWAVRATAEGELYYERVNDAFAAVAESPARGSRSPRREPRRRWRARRDRGSGRGDSWILLAGSRFLFCGQSVRVDRDSWLVATTS